MNSKQVLLTVIAQDLAGLGFSLGKGNLGLSQKSRLGLGEIFPFSASSRFIQVVNIGMSTKSIRNVGSRASFGEPNSLQLVKLGYPGHK